MKKLIPLLLIGWLALTGVSSAYAQSADPQLTLKVKRDFGYGGFDNKIEGLFTISAEGPDDLAQVDFYIDDTLMASISTAPFSHQFSTSEYDPGEHTLSAVGTTSDGQQLQSNQVVNVFLTKEEAGKTTAGFVIPILVGAAAVALIAGLFTAVGGRGKPFNGKYSLLGGTVCSRCGLPYSRSAWAPNMVVGKLQRCPHCGKWNLARRASPDELAAAEARWHGEQPSAPSAEDEAQRTRRQIDDSRFEE